MIGVLIVIDKQVDVDVAVRKIKSYRWFFGGVFISWMLLLWLGSFSFVALTKERYVLMLVADFLILALVLSKAADVKCPQCGNEFFRCLVTYPKFLGFLNTFVRQINPFNRECDQCGFRINFF